MATQQRADCRQRGLGPLIERTEPVEFPRIFQRVLRLIGGMEAASALIGVDSLADISLDWVSNRLGGGDGGGCYR